jgi:hypothetical protein
MTRYEWRSRRCAIQTAQLCAAVVLLALVGAGVGYIAPPLVSGILGTPAPPEYWEAHRVYQQIGAVIGAAIAVGGVLLLAGSGGS